MLSLVQGGFAFIAGQVAHTGGLNFDTPVATMGIRGTAGGSVCASPTACQYFANLNVDGSISVYQLTPHAGSTVPLRVEIGTLVQISASGTPTFAPVANLDPAIGSLMNQLTQDYPQIIQNLFVPQPSPPSPTPDPNRRTDNPTDTQPTVSAILGSSNTVALTLPTNTLQNVPTPDSVTPDLTAPIQAFLTITLLSSPSLPPDVPLVLPITVANPIGNQTSPEDTVWNFTVPDTLFSDPAATLSATLANGDPLASVGLSFDPATRTISGTPPQDFNGPIVISVSTSAGAVTDSFALNVTPVNDAPVVTSAVASLTPIAEDAVDPTGQTVAAILAAANFSDAKDQVPGGSSANAFAGIAVSGNAATAAQGTWEYFDGANWVDISSALSDSHALLLSEGTLLRFLPAHDFNGAAPALTVHLIDDSGGPIVAGGFVDLTATGTGGSTPYSTDTVTVGETVTAVNDAPVATDDVATTHLNTAVDFNVLANDHDPDGDVLSIFGTPSVLHGTVTVNANGTLHYVPTTSYFGADTITYGVTDGLLTATGHVVMTVGVNIVGTTGNDVIDDSHAPAGQPFATAGNDTIFGQTGNDVIHGGGGNDSIDGGAGNDMLYGDAGNDTLIGSDGIDQLFGGDGDDTFVVSGTIDANDVFDGGPGTDTILVARTVPLTLAGFNALTSSIEAWQGNNQAVLGTSAANVFDFSGLQSKTGIAFVDAGDGNDTIIGSRFSDDLRGGAANDILVGGQGDDLLSGGTGANTFQFKETLAGSANFGHDSILDFQTALDVIEFDHSIFADFADVLTHAADDGLGNTVITANVDNAITLQHVALANLHASNFAFV